MIDDVKDLRRPQFVSLVRPTTLVWRMLTKQGSDSRFSASCVNVLSRGFSCPSKRAAEGHDAESPIPVS